MKQFASKVESVDELVVAPTKYHKLSSHITYRLADGSKVPGASTIAKVGSDTEPLIAWAWRCGMDGQDYKKVRENAADIGSLAHFRIQCYLRGEEPDLSEFSPADVSRSGNCFLKFLAFWENERLSIIASEAPLVSEQHRYGGTVDIVGNNNMMTLLDWKSSKAIYLEHELQLSAYEQLWNENNPSNPISRRAIVRIGKDESNADMEIRWLGDMGRHFEVFKCQLKLYQAKRELK